MVWLSIQIMDDELDRAKLYLSIKEMNELKSFFTNIRLTVSLIEDPLVRAKGY